MAEGVPEYAQSYTVVVDRIHQDILIPVYHELHITWLHEGLVSLRLRNTKDASCASRVRCDIDRSCLQNLMEGEVIDVAAWSLMFERARSPATHATLKRANAIRSSASSEDAAKHVYILSFTCQLW